MEDRLTVNAIDEPVVYFEKLGGLHDARITAFSWSKSNRRFILSVDDLNSNFLDLPEYQGLRPAEVIFSKVALLDSDIQILDSSYSIYAMEIEQEKNGYKVDIRLSEGCRSHIEVVNEG